MNRNNSLRRMLMRSQGLARRHPNLRFNPTRLYGLVCNRTHLRRGLKVGSLWFLWSLSFGLGSCLLVAADQLQWGQAWSRNMVSKEKGLPDSFDAKTGKNIKWVA
ncbi:MAG: hypothetical protein ABI651_00825, partial [Verrucomicrobiota bacterium]